MAFAPPRRVAARTADHRKRTEVKGVATDVDNTKNHQKIRTVIETRHRAWLSDKPSNNNNDADQNITKFESTRLTQETSVIEPAAQEDVQQTEFLHVSDVNCSNLEGAFSYGYPGILKSKKDITGISDIGRIGRSDARATTSDYLATKSDYLATKSDYMATKSDFKTITSDYMATINKFKISKSAGVTTSGSNAYGAKPKLGIKPEKPLREASLRQDGAEPMTTAELRRKADELLNQAKASLHRYGRETRPESHFCPLCRRLMSLEGHNPICIIPCGHSVCEPCSRSLKKTCSICDHDIQTTTSNIVLKRIIEQFSEEHGLEPKQDSAISVAKASPESSSASPMRSVQSLTQRLEEIQQNRKTYLSDGQQDDKAYMLAEPAKRHDDSAYMLAEPAKRHDDSAYMLAEPAKRQDPPAAPAISQSSRTPVQLSEATPDPTIRRSNDAAQNTTIIPKIANINKQLTNLLKPFCGRDELSKTVTHVKAEVKEKAMFEDFPDYKPTEADLKKWTGELAAVEMRITVMELQARQTTTTISNIDARIASARSTLEQLEQREHQLLENLKFTKLQLQEADMERSKIMQQIKNDNAENERCSEQLNLINYTRAGLEAELDKLRLLCNRAS